ncbi:MAG: cysteine desulfurase [Rickettsiaceae bacterium]|nr:cysteine desulfurase [Rickettsiaceae bacterium]
MRLISLIGIEIHKIMIYLDHNATTNINPKVWSKMNELVSYGPLNPSSIHSCGQKGKGLLEEARKSLAYLLGFESDRRKYQITFTASGTEANNLIIANFKDNEIFISATEHLSIYAHSKYLKNITIVKVDKNGILDIDDLVNKLKKSKSAKKLLSVMLANNETGIIQPIKKICEIAHDYGALVHSDCVQAVGKIDVDMQDLGIDFLSISGHKFGGPMGSAALVARASVHLEPQIIGGGQERSLRSGTENVPAIVGFGFAAKLAKNELVERRAHMTKLQSKLEKLLLERGHLIEIAGADVERLPNTSLIFNLNKKAETQLIALDLQGVAVSSGSACSSGKSVPSHVLSAMGYKEDKIQSALRVSVGMDTKEADIDSFIEIYNKINK